MVKALACCFEQVNATSHVPSNSTLGDLHSPNVVVGFQSTASLESMAKAGSPNDGGHRHNLACINALNLGDAHRSR